MAPLPPALVIRDGRLCHPYDARRLLTPVTTGVLPADRPILERGAAYCGDDFRRRAVVWFTAAAAQQKAQANADLEKTIKAQRAAARHTLPTRIQPARAAKRRAAAVETAPVAVPRAKRRRMDSDCCDAGDEQGRPSSDYVADLAAFADAADPDPDHAAAAFLHDLNRLINNKRTALTSRCYWSSLAWPPGQSPDDDNDSSDSNDRNDRNARCRFWCPVVARPLACTDGAFCRHALGRNGAVSERTSERTSIGIRTTPSFSLPSRSPAPEAAMTPATTPLPPVTPPPLAMLQAQAKQFACARHVHERMVAIAGLRFAVDVCNGAVRVWMV